VHKCSRGGVACYRTGLRWAMCWRSSVMRCAGSTGSAVGVSSSPGILSGSSCTSSATDACKSSLNAVGIPRTRGSASVHCWSAWHMMAAFSVRWKRSTSPLAGGGGRSYVRAECLTAWPGIGTVGIQIDAPGRQRWSADNRSGIFCRSVGSVPRWRL
jgi:hypothetical protein